MDRTPSNRPVVSACAILLVLLIHTADCRRAAAQSPHDDPLGHVPPYAGGRLDTAIRQRGDWQPEHHAFLSQAFHDVGPVTFEYFYVGEVMNNARGGITTRNATQYEGLFDLTMQVDLEETSWGVPGRVFVLMQNTHGRGITEDFVGDAQVVSNIDTGDNIMQVSEYWWEVPLLDETLTVRLGKQDLNGEFLVVDMAGDFMQSSFGISPQSAVPTFPDPSMAAVILAQLTADWELKVGIWDGLPDGRTWGFSGTDLTFTVGEIEYSYALADGTLPGVFDVGIGYLSAGEISPGVRQSQAWGYYLDFEQIIFRENPCDEDDRQGMGLFVQCGFAHPRDAVLFKDYFGAGIVYNGPIPTRDDDVLGIGLAHARLNLGGTGRETVVEVFYKAHLTPAVTVQPDLQYIADPSGLYRDAVVLGLRFQVNL